MRTLAILGASGHGRVIADAALGAGWQEVLFFDDAWPERAECGPWKVLGRLEAFKRDFGRFDGGCIAIGDNNTRLRVHREMEAAGARLVSVAHTSAVVSPYAAIADGCVILANAVVGPFVKLGRSCIVNTGASVDHDCELADAVHVSPGARLGGAVNVGEAAWIGLGASVKHGLVIGSGATIGAGAAVVTDVPGSWTVVGVPAKQKRAG